MAGSCVTCQGLVKRDGQARFHLHFTPMQIFQSAGDGECSNCRLIWKGIRLMEDDTWSFDTDVSSVYAFGLAKSKDTLTLEIYFHQERPRLVVELFHMEAYQGKIPPCIARRPLVTSHPMSQDALMWVKDKVEACERNHSCHRVDASQLPSRVLALEPIPSGGVLTKLTKGSSIIARYACLSHCWGTGLSCTTTTSNLDSRINGIEWLEMPKTFRDAIMFCLRLGISYLWIDALCIIQDKKDDWEIHSARMADIYENAYITLAATSSCDDVGGFFPEQQASTDPGVASKPLSSFAPDRHSPLDWVGCQRDDKIFVRKKLFHWTDGSADWTKKNTPLLTRAWVFQERVLSPRMLHFCQNELAWECADETCCECGGLLEEASSKRLFNLKSKLEGDPPLNPSHDSNPPPDESSGLELDEDSQELLDDSSDESRMEERIVREQEWRRLGLGARIGSRLSYSDRQVRKLFLKGIKPHWAASEQIPCDNLLASARKLPVSSLLKAIRLWHNIVSNYSSLKLSHETDRLPALSGLAERMQRYLGCYRAGLWESSILVDLTWRVDYVAPGSQRPQRYLGPTWSWVSVGMSVAFWTGPETLSYPALRYRAACAMQEMEYCNSACEEVPKSCAKASVSLVKVGVSERNVYGAVSSGIIFITGPLQEGKLAVRQRDESKSDTGNLGFGVEVQLNKMSVTLPFFADYDLWAEGSGKVTTSDICILTIFSEIALVLLRTPLQLKNTPVYRRIGILKIFPAHYGIPSRVGRPIED